MASASAPLLLDLAWAVLTVQLMIITFWCSSEDIRRRLYSPSAPPPLPPVLDDRDAAVLLKKRRRRLHPKSVWDSEQVSVLRAALTAPACRHLSAQVSIAFERAGVKPMWVNALHTHLAQHPGCSSWTDVPHVSATGVHHRARSIAFIHQCQCCISTHLYPAAQSRCGSTGQ